MKVSVIMGSDSDLPHMKAAIDLLKDMKVPFEVKVISAHRTPQNMKAYALQAEKKGVSLILAGAGGAAHLPGMVASFTTLPVIGVPIATGSLKGLDSLLSIAQMPKGVPVATMAINNSFNAALLAVRILALKNQRLKKTLQEFHKKQKLKVKAANQNLKSFLKKT